MAKQNRRKELLHFFKTICRIPRQSGDEEAISRYMVEFAKSRGLAAERDAFCNVLIRKPATIPGYSGPTVILQGHMDMVYVKTPESAHIYKDGIRVKEEDGFLRAADGTSLGADNGLALACVMDLMDCRDLRLPALEILLTASEETGLEGVKNLGFHDVKGTYLINLDAEEEGVFITSCAGGVRTDLSLPLAYETKAEETGVLLTLEGLRGGHSGLDIGLGRANAVRILGRILSHANGLADCSYLESLGKANAIASQGSVRLHMSQERREALLEKLCSLERDVRQEFAGTEEIRFRIEERAGAQEARVLTQESMEKLIQAITLLPCGVLTWDRKNRELAQTSSNIGSMAIAGDRMIFLCSGRSSVKREKERLKEYMQILAQALGMQYRFHGDYPQWEYAGRSRLREICGEVYAAYSGRDAVFTGIHAGIECGYLAEKLGSHIDMISCGANLYDVHTPAERAEVESFYRMEEILIAVLEEVV